MPGSFKKTTLPAPGECVPGRAIRMPVPAAHAVLGHPLAPPFPAGMSQALLALGCFWGAERRFWGLPGVYTTAAGYAGGETPNPSYEEVCGGLTGHAEAVLVVFEPGRLPYTDLLRCFFESHDPTQGMRQGNDVGTQYRSVIFVYDEAQRQEALQVREAYRAALASAGHGAITTEVRAAPDFFYAAPYHQQYLAKNPRGYCGLAGTGVACPVGSSG
jgi:peptide-methionine (S)-S-oxide reductase